jgi:hypothetical protein
MQQQHLQQQLLLPIPSDGRRTVMPRWQRRFYWNTRTPSFVLFVTFVLSLVVHPTTLAFLTPPTTRGRGASSRFGRYHDNSCLLLLLLRETSSTSSTASASAAAATSMNVLKNKVTTPDMITFDNFWIQTVANFTKCNKPDRPPDFSSKGGSMYWKENKGVIRCSDHWTGQFGCGMIKDCYWSIDVGQVKKNQFLTGRCDYASFVKAKKRSMKKWSVRKENLTLSRLSTLQWQPLHTGAAVDETNATNN